MIGFFYKDIQLGKLAYDEKTQEFVYNSKVKNEQLAKEKYHMMEYYNLYNSVDRRQKELFEDFVIFTAILGRDDVVYIDLREANTNERDDGYADNNYMGVHLKGFKNIEFVSYIQGNKNQLFYVAPDKSLAPRYTTSLEILEELFPKDKAIFLMCDSGNKARSVMKLLAQYGWDMSKVYNVGAIANYGNSNYLLISTGAQKNDDI
jgi:rhodanese-related sulfurtransferase